MANRVYGYQGYKGYQFETSPKKLQPEYEPNKEQKINKKNKNKTVSKKTTKTIDANEEKKKKASKAEVKKKAKFVAYILFGFSVLFTISYRNSIINEKFNEKEALKAELAEIQKVNEQLEVSVENELNLTNVEKIAKEKLGMNKLSNNQKVYINLPKKEYVESQKNTGIFTQNSENIYQKVYNRIKEFFS